MPESSKSHGAVLCWVNEEEADGGPTLPFTHPLTSVLCFYDSGGTFHATPVAAIPRSSPSGSSCSQLQSSPWVSPAAISRHASQAGDCVQVAQSLSPGLSALPAPCSSKSLKTPSPSRLVSAWERAFQGGQNLSSIRASSQGAGPVLWKKGTFYPPFHPTVLCGELSCAPWCLSFPTRRYCENCSMCRYICVRR